MKNILSNSLIISLIFCLFPTYTLSQCRHSKDGFCQSDSTIYGSSKDSTISDIWTYGAIFTSPSKDTVIAEGDEITLKWKSPGIDSSFNVFLTIWPSTSVHDFNSKCKGDTVWTREYPVSYNSLLGWIDKNSNLETSLSCCSWNNYKRAPNIGKDITEFKFTLKKEFIQAINYNYTNSPYIYIALSFADTEGDTMKIPSLNTDPAWNCFGVKKQSYIIAHVPIKFSKDTTPPFFITNYPTVSSVSGTGFDIAIKSNENSTAYYVVLKDGISPPTSSEVKSGTAGGGTIGIALGSKPMKKETETIIKVKHLDPGTNYDVYVALEDSSSNPNLQSAPVKLDVTTPVPVSLKYPSDESVVGLQGLHVGKDSLLFNWSSHYETGVQYKVAIKYFVKGETDTLSNSEFVSDTTYTMPFFLLRMIHQNLHQQVLGNNLTKISWDVTTVDSKQDPNSTNGPFTITLDGGLLKIHDGELIPETFSLHANYPNPFNPTTTISYDLPKRSQVTLGIYDLLGKQIKTLVNQSQDAGNKIAMWDGTDYLGRQVSAGVYLYQIQAGAFTQTRKMLLLK